MALPRRIAHKKTSASAHGSKFARRLASPAAAIKPKTYTCKNCGRVTRTASHLCSPERTKDFYVCTFCGITSGDKRHVCSPMLAGMKYYCKHCGRVTPFRGAVCQPREIK
jgi:hypothetical protein